MKAPAKQSSGVSLVYGGRIGGVAFLQMGMTYVRPGRKGRGNRSTSGHVIRPAPRVLAPAGSILETRRLGCLQRWRVPRDRKINGERAISDVNSMNGIQTHNLKVAGSSPAPANPQLCLFVPSDGQQLFCGWPRRPGPLPASGVFRPGHAVAETAFGEVVFRVLGAVAELADGVAHGLQVGAAPAVPYPTPEGVAGRRLVDVGREGVREPVLDGGASHGAARDGHPARRAVDGRLLCSRRELAYDGMTHTSTPPGKPGRFGRD